MTAFTLDSENDITVFASLKKIQGSKEGTETSATMGSSRHRSLQDSAISPGMLKRSKDLNMWDTRNNCGSFLLPNSWVLSSSWFLVFRK